MNSSNSYVCSNLLGLTFTHLNELPPASCSLV